MKNKKILILIAVAVMLFVILMIPNKVLAASSIKNVNITSTGIMTWDAFEGADKYLISLDGIGYEVAYNNRRFDLYNKCFRLGFANGTYVVKLNALNGTTVISEDWFGSYTYHMKLPFPDVEESKWYYPSIDYVYSQNLMSGYTSGPNIGKFGVKDPITRGQIATILYRLAGEPDTTGLANPFSDVPEGKYYTEAVKWAFSKGITTGKTATIFDPDRPVTRQELAVFMARYAKEILGKNITSTYDITGIADYKDLSTWARAPMQYIMEKGVITGDMELGYARILPRNNATRAEAATMFMRFCQNIIHLDEPPV